MAAEEVREDGSGLGGEDAEWEGEDHGGGVGRGNAVGGVRALCGRCSPGGHGSWRSLSLTYVLP